MKRKIAVIILPLILIIVSLAVILSIKYYNDNKKPEHILEMSDAIFTEYNDTLILDQYTAEYKEILVPESIDNKKITTISPYAFMDSDVEWVYFEDGVDLLNDGAFYRCESLIRVDLPNTLITIGQDCFNGCALLKEINIPDSVKNLYAGAFQDCTALKKISLSPSINEIPRNAFMNTGIVKLDIPNGIKTIAVDAFWNCDKLTDVTLPASIENIDDTAFPQTVLFHINNNKSLMKLLTNAKYTNIEVN